MSTRPILQNIVPLASETAVVAQQNMTHFSKISERFIKGLMNTAVEQIELSRSLLEDGMSDFNLLSQARTPDAFVQAEFEVMRRQAERTLGTIRKMSEGVRRSWADAFEASPQN